MICKGGRWTVPRRCVTTLNPILQSNFMNSSSNITDQTIKYFFLLLTCLICHGCYSFRNVSLPPDIETYYVDMFKNNADNIPVTLPQTFTEGLKEKIRTQSRLTFDDATPHLEFKGTIVDFRISSEAPQPGELTAINRLTIMVAIDFINNKQSDKGWKNNFSHFFDFSSDQDFNSVQETAIQAIMDQLMEDIFNKAFTDW